MGEDDVSLPQSFERQSLKEYFRESIHKELRSDNMYYVDIYEDRSLLDGWYSQEDLRKIANAMEKLKLKYEELDK